MEVKGDVTNAQVQDLKEYALEAVHGHVHDTACHRTES